MTTITDGKSKDCDTTNTKLQSGFKMGLLERSQQLHYLAIKEKFRNTKTPDQVEIERLSGIVKSLTKTLENFRREEIFKVIEQRDKLAEENAELKRKLSIIFPPNKVFLTKNHVPLKLILMMVCDTEGFSMAEILSPRKFRPLSDARQIAFYLAKKFTTKSYPEIGRYFGDRDHSTVFHGIRKVGNLRKTDAVLAEKLLSYETMIEQRASQWADSVTPILPKTSTVQPLAPQETPAV